MQYRHLPRDSWPFQLVLSNYRSYEPLLKNGFLINSIEGYQLTRAGGQWMRSNIGEMGKEWELLRRANTFLIFGFFDPKHAAMLKLVWS